MTEPLRFICRTCGQAHATLPSFGSDAPAHYYALAPDERSRRAQLTADTCVIDGELFFVRGCVELRVHGADEPFIWGVWVSLSARSFATFTQVFEDAARDRAGPFFGWLQNLPPVYPDADLKTMVHLRPPPLRPYIELEPTRHPLALEQQQGLSLERVQQIVEALLHAPHSSASP